MRPQRDNRNARGMKPKSEFDDRMLEVRRVTRVMAGGKRFSFRATVVIGDRKGRVGIGIAKGLDVMAAITKAKRQAEKDVFTVPRKDSRTIPYMVEAKHGAARVRIKPAKMNHGLIAGGPARVIFELAGIKDITAKITGRTKNKLSNAMATMKALRSIRLPAPKAKTAEHAAPGITLKS